MKKRHISVKMRGAERECGEDVEFIVVDAVLVWQWEGAGWRIGQWGSKKSGEGM